MIEILTNLPSSVATAAVVVERYRGRWTVEGLFLRRTQVLTCEVNTLGYPPAALFGFVVALAAGNAYAAVTGALRAAHGPEVADQVSDDHLAMEVSGTRSGLEIAVPAEVWSEVGGRTVSRMAAWLVGLARGAKLGRYRTAPRGPKKPRPPRTRFAEAKHGSTARLLKGEQTRCVERDDRARALAAPVGVVNETLPRPLAADRPAEHVEDQGPGHRRPDRPADEAPGVPVRQPGEVPEPAAPPRQVGDVADPGFIDPDRIIAVEQQVRAVPQGVPPLGRPGHERLRLDRPQALRFQDCGHPSRAAHDPPVGQLVGEPSGPVPAAVLQNDGHDGRRAFVAFALPQARLG